MGKTCLECISVIHTRTIPTLAISQGCWSCPAPVLGPPVSRDPQGQCTSDPGGGAPLQPGTLTQHLDFLLPSFCPDSSSFPKQTLMEHLLCVICFGWYNTGVSTGKSHSATSVLQKTMMCCCFNLLSYGIACHPVIDN